MDWSKIENIIFVSAIGVLALFLAVSAIAVIVKGKRRRNGFDVFLRIISSLVFALSVVLFAAFVFTQLDGSYRIDVSGEPTLEFGSASVTLPLPFIFVAVSTTVGSNLVTALLVISLITLICDCLLANVKKDKFEKIQPAQKIEEDDGIGANTANSAVATDDQAVGDVPADGSDESAPVDNGEEETEEHTEESVTDSDEEQITNDAVANEPDAEPSDKPWYNEDGKFDIDEQIRDRHNEEQQTPIEEDEELEEVASAQEQTEGREELEFYEQPVDTEERAEEEAFEDNEYASNDESEISVEDEEAIGEQAATESESYEDVDEPVSDEYVEDEIIDDKAEDEQTDEVEDEAVDEITDDGEIPWYAQTGDEATEAAEQPSVRSEEPEKEQTAVDAIEPDRDIYIPEIRTVERTESATKTDAAQTKKKTERPARAQRRAVPPRQSKQPTEPTMAERAASAAIRNGAKRNSSSKLPVNRRYVILDRRSAVNIFSDYLKDRDKTDKDKLESSINKIIIK